MDINNPAPITASSVIENDNFNSPLDAWIQRNGVDTQLEVDKADLISIFNPNCHPRPNPRLNYDFPSSS